MIMLVCTIKIGHASEIDVLALKIVHFYFGRKMVSDIQSNFLHRDDYAAKQRKITSQTT